MRLRERDLQTIFHKKRILTSNDEGDDVISYSDESTALKMNVQSASGAVNAQIYGKQLSSMKSCKYQGDFLKEGQNELDGICVYVGADKEPDFEIVSIQPFSTHMNIMLGRRDEGGG